MDVEAFAAELPALFDDFPRSERPRNHAFTEIVRTIPNLATENVLALLNLAARLLGPGESYVEVGTYYGASLIGAMRGNAGDFLAIDAFEFGPLEVEGRTLPRADRAGLEANLRRFGSEQATILQGDAFAVLEGGLLGERRVGVYYYDGPHGYTEQVRGMRAIEPWLAPEALIVVDDFDWAEVARATRDYLAGQPRARLLLEIPGREGGLPQWWDGMAALAWRARSAGDGSSRPGHRPLRQVEPV